MTVAGPSEFDGGVSGVGSKNRAFEHGKYQNWIDPAKVTPYERNAKIHTDRQIGNIVNSIRRFGWQQDTVLTSDGVLVIGHGRRLAALRLGCEMPYHTIDKTAEELTDADIRELRIADNQINAETGFDADMLDAECEDLDFDGFEFDFLEDCPDVSELDADTEPDGNTVVRLVFSDYKSYSRHETEIKDFAERVGASVTVGK